MQPRLQPTVGVHTAPATVVAEQAPSAQTPWGHSARLDSLPAQVSSERNMGPMPVYPDRLDVPPE